MIRWALIPIKSVRFNQCLGSGYVGSARLWLSGTGSGKIWGSTDPDPRCKISTKNCKNKILSLNPNLNYWKKNSDY